MDYQAILAVHLVAVAIFVSGLVVAAVMMPSLAVAITPRQQTELRRVRRWNLWLTTPALLVVWVAGLTLAIEGGWFAAAWLHAKIALVLLLSGLHGMQSARLRRLGRNAVTDAARRAPFWPVPTILLLVIAVIGLAVVKP